jgi:uncharacterized protein YxeA
MKTLYTLIAVVIVTTGFAQNTLVADQNPNYMISQQKYMKMVDSVQTTTMNTTAQETYKAYDWYEEKQQRRQTRFNTRQQVRINRSLYNGWNNWNDPWNNNWNNPWNDPWNNGWNNRWGWRNRFIPHSIGFNTGNWWFWF